MSDQPFYTPTNHGVQPRQRTPGERLWTMTKKGHTCHAEVRPGPMTFVELQIFADDEFRWGKVVPNRDWAITIANVKREELRVKGWNAADL